MRLKRASSLGSKRADSLGSKRASSLRSSVAKDRYLISPSPSRLSYDKYWETKEEKTSKEFNEKFSNDEQSTLKEKNVGIRLMVETDKKNEIKHHPAEEFNDKRCERTVYRNKYERDAPEIRRWWSNTFKTLEEDAAIPPEEQYSLLNDMFDKSILTRILKICSTHSRKFKEEFETYTDEDIDQMMRNARDDFSETSSAITNKRDKSNISDYDAEELKGALFRTKSKNMESLLTHQQIPKCKMYVDFFKRQASRAAIWRSLPPLSLDEMNLNQKADAITAKIATDFINWLKDLGGDEELSLSVEAVIEMFEIGFHANAATSLKVHVKELPSIPRRVAEVQHLPKKAKRAVLRNTIAKDVKASKKKTTYTAFGTHLPDDMQVRPPAENYYRKWITCDRVPEKLASMATVWQGITHLKSTRAFCEFLIERPEIQPPKYLYDAGMMDLKTLKERDKNSKSTDEGLNELDRDFSINNSET